MIREETHEYTDESGLTDKQERTIAAMLTHATIRDAAKAAQVSEATICRWKHDPIFADALRSAQNAQMQAAVGYSTGWYG